MTNHYQNRLKLLSETHHRTLLGSIHHGIEKEGLRVTPTGQLSQKSHPKKLGKALTHPYITTDFSEALMEFITPVHRNLDDTFAFLNELHCFASHYLDEEFIWSGSMPCTLDGETSIPIACYGHSNTGRMKSIYREGLAHRYGKAMQTIAGIHYNFSLPPEFWQIIWPDQNENHGNDQERQSRGYFALIRNFKRYAWLLMYLFGASPAVSTSFFMDGHASDHLLPFDEDTLYLPFATSLRMSDMGYTNNAQTTMNVDYNTLDNYVASLRKALETPYKPYNAIGVRQGDHYLQLNENLLQIENEYYSGIRPKRIIHSGERPVTALIKNGVEYIEVRCLDINPFEPLGISVEDARFMDIFLLFCALKHSPLISEDEKKSIHQNFSKTVSEGRNPELRLCRNKRSVSIPEWGNELLEAMTPLAILLDKQNSTGSRFRDSLSLQQQKMSDRELTPSAKILKSLRDEKTGYSSWVQCLSKKYQQDFRHFNMAQKRTGYFQDLSERSRQDFEHLERQLQPDFDTFLAQYNNIIR
ncbi:Glutamate--cysteine ligase [invertebrate metagenome]|uniref:glutamate--cysteine ligase n=1 Tax=invertebrate metagenome TaxID=1711999 RepID=A0A2H9TC07_9ZZZZ